MARQFEAGAAQAAMSAVGAAAALAAAVVGVPLALAAGIHLATARRVVGLAAVPRTPVALVLGAEVYPDGRPSAYLRARLDVAIELYRLGLVETLLLSGDGGSPFYDEPSAMRAYVLARGVPEDAVEVDPAGFDTYASCARARDVFGHQELTVVSQRYHLPRALAICGLLGMDAWGVGDIDAHRSGWWGRGTRREVAANLKLVWDVVSRRPWVRSPG